MNKNKNSYIIIYATVMVVVVAVLLSFTALKLKSRQDDNVKMEKMGDILRSVGQGAQANEVEDKLSYINEQYAKYIVNSYTVNVNGDVTEGADPFEIALNLKAEYDKPAQERNLPIFEARMDDGSTRYIIPVYGSGLWGPIWGYLALNNDFATIFGTIFGHQGETPGLGAEIATPMFEGQFSGKNIYSGDQLVGISVLKGAGSSAGNPNAVDAISGGTITSRAVETMLKNNLADYAVYFEKMRSGADNTAQPAEETAAAVADSTTVNLANHEQ